MQMNGSSYTNHRHHPETSQSFSSDYRGYASVGKTVNVTSARDGGALVQERERGRWGREGEMGEIEMGEARVSLVLWKPPKELLFISDHSASLVMKSTIFPFMLIFLNDPFFDKLKMKCY